MGGSSAAAGAVGGSSAAARVVGGTAGTAESSRPAAGDEFTIGVRGGVADGLLLLVENPPPPPLPRCGVTLIGRGGGEPGDVVPATNAACGNGAEIDSSPNGTGLWLLLFNGPCSTEKCGDGPELRAVEGAVLSVGGGLTLLGLRVLLGGGGFGFTAAAIRPVVCPLPFTGVFPALFGPEPGVVGRDRLDGDRGGPDGRTHNVVSFSS